MADRSQESISRWLDSNLYKFDGPAQYLPRHGAQRRPPPVGRGEGPLAARGVLGLQPGGRQHGHPRCL